MANVSNGGGFRPVRHLNGAPWNGKTRMYYTSDAVALFKGDAVVSDGTADATGKYAGVKQAPEGGNLRGVVMGFSDQPYAAFDASDLYRNYKLATEDLYCMVVDDPDVIFELEEDNDTSDLTIAEIGLNTDLVVGTGDTASGKSGMKLDSDGTTTGAAQLRILGVSNKEDNALGTACKYDVLINEHELRAVAGGV